MALENGNSNGMVMPVSPMGFGGYGGGWGNGFGGFGGDGWWVILFLFALMGNGGWGGFGGWGGMNGLGFGLGLDSYLFNTQTQNDVNRGFDNAGLSGQLSGIQSSISNGFASAEVADCNRAMNAMQTAYNNQIADMNQRFTLATEVDDRLDTLSLNLQKCCCDNELAIANTQAVIQREAAENRFQSANNTRDIITNATANTQSILDKLCQLELDGYKTQLAQAQAENLALRNQASQNAQTAQLLADNAAQTAALQRAINPPIEPSYIVPNPYAYNFYPNGGWGNNCGCNGYNSGIA